ncbi:MAG: hypothetical protein ACLUPV_01935 [Bilophila wadsworthia]
MIMIIIIIIIFSFFFFFFSSSSLCDSAPLRHLWTTFKGGPSPIGKLRIGLIRSKVFGEEGRKRILEEPLFPPLIFPPTKSSAPE